MNRELLRQKLREKINNKKSGRMLPNLKQLKKTKEEYSNLLKDPRVTSEMLNLYNNATTKYTNNKIPKPNEILDNPDKYKEETKKYYLKTREIQAEKKKKWISENREKYNSYWTNRKKNDEVFKLLTGMRSRIWKYTKLLNITKKNTTFEIVGCSPQHLKEYLEKQFVPGMSWENRTEWNIDHIIPLSSAKTEEELYKLCHYTNLQPLWAEENLKKSNKILI
jgi:hypothetical protein